MFASRWRAYLTLQMAAMNEEETGGDAAADVAAAKRAANAFEALTTGDDDAGSSASASASGSADARARATVRAEADKIVQSALAAAGASGSGSGAEGLDDAAIAAETQRVHDALMRFRANQVGQGQRSNQHTSFSTPHRCAAFSRACPPAHHVVVARCARHTRASGARRDVAKESKESFTLSSSHPLEPNGKHDELVYALWSGSIVRRRRQFLFSNGAPNGGAGSGSSSALYAFASLMNHACSPRWGRCETMLAWWWEES